MAGSKSRSPDLSNLFNHRLTVIPKTPFGMTNTGFFNKPLRLQKDFRHVALLRVENGFWRLV
jgi:hypothetical protein